MEFGIELGGTGADLGGTDGGAAELLDDGGDFAGGDALDIHFGQGEFEGLFAADALFQGAGIEVHAVAHLRDTELDGADAGGEGFGFEAVGVALAGLGAFVRLGLEGVGAFQAHGFVDEQAHALGEAFEAFAGEELQDGVQEFRIGLVGHVCFDVGCVWLTPQQETIMARPRPVFRARSDPSGVRLRSARYARLRSAAPGWGAHCVVKNQFKKKKP